MRKINISTGKKPDNEDFGMEIGEKENSLQQLSPFRIKKRTATFANALDRYDPSTNQVRPGISALATIQPDNLEPFENVTEDLLVSPRIDPT